MTEKKMDKIVALCKRKGFIYPGSEIYGGLAGTWDYGPYGSLLKKNITELWWKMFVEDREDMYGVDAAILMSPRVWEASGHVAGFSDPLVECKKCKKRFRADHVETDECPACGGELGEERQFNMMFKTHVGATEDESSVSYLRPETAGGMFVNFKNIIDSFHPKLPFGLGQIGKAFRNEIAPRDFIFRTREFEQMEVEYFVREEEWEKHFEMWRNIIHTWCDAIGLHKDHVHELEVSEEDRAHYSKRTIDFEFDFPFGKKELYGLAYRTDYDLKKHAAYSGKDLSYKDQETGESVVPHVIEPSLGLDRTVLAILTDAYTEDVMGGEERIYLKFKPSIAPVKIAVFPLVKNKQEVFEKAEDVYKMLKKNISGVVFDASGTVGKRYRRQDEIGTPFCVTIDFDTIEKDDTVTVRDRDTGEQTRVSVGELVHFFSDKI